MLYKCYSDPLEDIVNEIRPVPIWTVEANNFDEMKKKVNDEMYEQGYVKDYWTETDFLGYRALTDGNYNYIISATL